MIFSLFCARQVARQMERQWGLASRLTRHNDHILLTFTGQPVSLKFTPDHGCIVRCGRLEFVADLDATSPAQCCRLLQQHNLRIDLTENC